MLLIMNFQVENLSVEECTRRWKSLRDRELKKVKYKKTGEPGPAYVSCWIFFESMLFLGRFHSP